MSVLRVLFIAGATGGFALAWYRVVFPDFVSNPGAAIVTTLLLLAGYAWWILEGMK